VETDPLQAIQAASSMPVPRWDPIRRKRPSPTRQLTACRAGPQEQRTEYDRQNDQQQKAGFGQEHGKQESDYLNSARKPALASLKSRLAGSFQPCSNSSSIPICRADPALVRENVYDSASAGTF